MVLHSTDLVKVYGKNDGAEVNTRQSLGKTHLRLPKDLKLQKRFTCKSDKTRHIINMYKNGSLIITDCIYLALFRTLKPLYNSTIHSS